MSRTIIGLTGYAGSGKDEAAKGLILELGFVRVSFAEPLRRALLALNPMCGGTARVTDVVERFGWDEAKVLFPEVRELLQRFGTEVGRKQFGENFWVEQAVTTIAKLNRNLPVVLTDVRFPNECEIVKKHGGKIVKIVRPGVRPVNNHISDAGIDHLPVDHIIYNDKSIEELHNEIVQFAKCMNHTLVKLKVQTEQPELFA